MTKNDLKQIQDSVKVVVRPVMDIVEILKQKVSSQGFMITNAATNIRKVKEQQSVINEKLTNMQKNLDNHTEKIDMIWEQTVHLTETTAGIEETLDSHTDFLKRMETNNERSNGNIKRVDKRVAEIEDRLGIAPPPEFTVI